MEWTQRKEEFRTTVTDDGAFAIVLRRVTLAGVQGPWRSTVTRTDTSAEVMTGEDADVKALTTACKDWLKAFYTARERDPRTDNYPAHQ